MYGEAFSTCRMLSKKKKLRITSNISRTARLMRLRGGFEAQRKGDYAICTKNIKKNSVHSSLLYLDNTRTDLDLDLEKLS